MLRALLRVRQRPEEVAHFVQTAGLVRAARLVARALGEPPPRPRDCPEWLVAVMDHCQARICRMDAEEAPEPREVGALEAALSFVEAMPASKEEEFQSLLALIEVAPYVFGPRRARFTALSGEEQDAHLQSWELSRLEGKRAGFRGLKSVAMMGFWTRPATFGWIQYSVAENPGVPERLRQEWAKREAVEREGVDHG